MSSLIKGLAFHAVPVTLSDDTASVSGENGALDEMGKGQELNKAVLKEEPEEFGDQGKKGQSGTVDTLSGVDQGSSNISMNMVDGAVLETVVVIDSVETAHVNREQPAAAKVGELRLSKVAMEEPKRKVSESGKDACVIDMKGGNGIGFGGNLDVERVCRICHLSSEQVSDVTAVSSANITTSADLIHLGCMCKDELGVAHSHCAEAWFKLKGNRLCEICGETAKNVKGVGDGGFMEEWNEGRLSGSSSTPSVRGCGCWRGQPFCNFLMACLVIAFVLPWFFRVNMF